MSDLHYPVELAYSHEHTWARVEENLAVIGITAFAQHQLGDVVFIDLPVAGTQVTQGTAFGSIESVKSTSDLIAPVSGLIMDVNSALEQRPDLINEDPYGAGWIIKVRLGPSTGLERLLGHHAYADRVQKI